MSAYLYYFIVNLFSLDTSYRLVYVSIAMVAIGLLTAWAARIPLVYNLRNLKVRYRTTILTGLAFTMVAAVLTGMLGFVNGLKAITDSSGKPENVLVLSEGSTDEGFSNLGIGDVSEIEQQIGIAQLDGQPMSSREAIVVINQPIEDPPPGRQKRRFLQIRGVENPSLSATVHGFGLMTGSEWFSEAGVRQSAEVDSFPMIEVALGEGIARELGADRKPELLEKARNRDRLDVGDTITLDKRKLFVVGIMNSGGSTYDSEVWAKRSVVGPLFGKESYSSVVLKATDAKAATELSRFFNEDYAKASVRAYTEPEYFKSLGQTNQQLLYGTIFVAIIMAFGGVMGVMNTMFAAISQRIRDIGVLRLLGFGSWRILVSFLVESLLIALLGGVVGCAIGYLFNGYSATSIVSGSGGGGKSVVFKVVVDMSVIGIAIFLSLLMGLVGGLIPAVSAMWKRPLESLRG